MKVLAIGSTINFGTASLFGLLCPAFQRLRKAFAPMRWHCERSRQLVQLIGTAEGVGFEPTVGFPTLDFESSALNRTQPPFLDLAENRVFSIRDPTVFVNAMSSRELDKGHRGRRCIRLLRELPEEAKKCYNFRLATPTRRTASCVSTRTATLLLVVDRYSQVPGAAVHHYSQLIRKP